MALENKTLAAFHPDLEVEIITVYMIRPLERTEEYRLFTNENLDPTSFIDIKANKKGERFLENLNGKNQLMIVRRGALCLAAYGPLEEDKLYVFGK